MSRDTAPLRSVLYAPGANSRALQKAKALPIDALILDLEDAVAPDAKETARACVVEALSSGGYGDRKCVVRINGLETPWGREDVQAVATAGADAVLLPKVEAPDDVTEAAELLSKAGGPADLPLWIMAETPRGILDIDHIAGADPRLEAIVLGTSDLSKELQVRHSADRIGFIASLGLCVLAARAHDLAVLDGVYLDLQDADGFEIACEQGRDMGFDGKTLIHPGQIEAANRVFGISDAELARAQKILQAWQEAESSGRGVCVVDGRLVENLHVAEARRLLAMHEVICARS